MNSDRQRKLKPIGLTKQMKEEENGREFRGHTAKAAV